MLYSVLSWLVLLMPIGVNRAAENTSREPAGVKPTGHAKAILAAKDSEALRHAYRRLFKSKSDAEIRRLFASENDGIALQSAWESVVRSIKPHLKDKSAKKLRSAYRTKSQWFVGFVEGRLGVTPPKWWTRRLLSGQVHDRFTLLLRTYKAKDMPFNSLKIPVLPRGHTSKVTDAGLSYSTGKQTFSIPTAAMSKTQEAWDSLRVDATHQLEV